MKIHHYTTIETLALILKYRTIRFNRLDKVDDLEESKYGISTADLRMGKYNFASCWTRDANESIPLWNLYTKNKGVRISLEEDMFITYPINNSFKSFFKENINPKEDYLIYNGINEAILIDVEYVDDLKMKITEIGSCIENNVQGRYKMEFTNDFGKFKSKHWEFQKESRFIIRVIPIKWPEMPPPKDIDPTYFYLNEFMESIPPSYFQNKSVSVDYFDINLNTIAYNNMEILLAPETNETEKIIVDSLVNKYCPSAKVKESKLKGKIKSK